MTKKSKPAGNGASLTEYQPGQAFPGVIGRTFDVSKPAWPDSGEPTSTGLGDNGGVVERAVRGGNGGAEVMQRGSTHPLDSTLRRSFGWEEGITYSIAVTPFTPSETPRCPVPRRTAREQ